LEAVPRSGSSGFTLTYRSDDVGRLTADPTMALMARKVDIIAALLDDSRELEDIGRGIQGERELLASDEAAHS
jgi:hypothetical protein